MAPREIGGALAIEVEMMRERASSLRRVSGKLETLIDRLQAIRSALPAARPQERTGLQAEYARLRAEAETQRWYMIVQREAMGLFHHEDVDQLYAIPGPLGS